MYHPDYTCLRDEIDFFIDNRPAYSALFGVMDQYPNMHDYYTDIDTGVTIHKEGLAKYDELAGDRFGPAPVMTPPISYGHINVLGADLVFPDNQGEVSFKKICTTLEEATELVKKRPDIASSGMMPFYLQYHEALQKAFPSVSVGLGMSAEGPLTTAYELLGNLAFTAPYDQPDAFETFLNHLTDSIIDYRRWQTEYFGRPYPDPDGGGICDDIAAFYPPPQWERFVLPFINRILAANTTGKRWVHIEDLKRDQLPFLEEIETWMYDPSISAQINPAMITATCRVPYKWRLGSFHYATMDLQDIEDFVYTLAADGATGAHTVIAQIMVKEPTWSKVLHFDDVAHEVAEKLQSGASRESLRVHISDRGRRRFWNNWPD